MAKRRAPKAVRTASGYRWRGRTVAFGKLPKKERARFHSLWAKKGKRKKAQPRLARGGPTMALVRARRHKARSLWAPNQTRGNKGQFEHWKDLAEGESNERAVFTVWELQKTERPDFDTGALGCVIEWPEDPRSEASRSYQTFYSHPPRTLTLYLVQDFIYALDDIEATGGGLNRERNGKEGSRGFGKATIVMVSLLAWKAKAKGARK